MNLRRPLDGADLLGPVEIIDRHSGEGPDREWNMAHNVWLNLGDYLIRDARGDVWLAHFRKLPK